MTSAERAKDKRLQKTYKLTLAAQNLVLAEQNGCCAICDRPFAPLQNADGKSFTAFQDHWHACCDPKHSSQHCGKCNRGLLCYICNKFVVGYMEKKKIDPNRLAAYMNKWAKILLERGACERIQEAKARPKKRKKAKAARGRQKRSV